MDSTASDLRLLGQNQEWFSKECRELQARASSEWKDPVNHTKTVRSSLQIQFEKLQGIEDEILAKEKRLEATEMELKVKIDSEARQVDRIEILGKQLLQEVEVNRQAAEANRQEAASLQLKIDKKRKELEDGQKRYHEIRVLIEEKEREFDHVQKDIKLKEEKLTSIENSILDCSNELELKENHLDLLQKLKEENLDSLKKLVDQCARKFDFKEREFESLVKEIELKENFLELKCKGFDMISKKVNDCLKEVELKEEMFASVQRLVEECSRELVEKEKEFEGRVKDFELRVKEFELKLKANIPHCLVQIEQPEQTQTSFASQQSHTPKQKKDMLWVLNQQLKRHNLVCDETFTILKTSSDPGKLVLDAIQGIHHSHSSGECMEFDETLVWRGCILLSELLMKASPEISPQVNEEAAKLAREWRAKVTVARENALEVLGLLQFIASYKLASAFDANELHNLLDVVGFNFEQESFSVQEHRSTSPLSA